MALAGLKVIEFAGLAPGPFAGLILALNGASVIRIDRPNSRASSIAPDVLCRGKRSIIIDSKLPEGKKLLQQLISSADVLIDPFRPGVLERLGLGPEVFLGPGGADGQVEAGLNKKLVYARLAGFPTTGAYKDMAGHDINYLALSGILSMLPGEGKPNFPLNLVADFAGGGLMCALGILLALVDRSRTGLGQVVNTDMVSGTRFLSTFPLSLSTFDSNLFNGPRGTNILDGGAPFYGTYTCKDGRWMSVGCIESQFFKAFIETFVDALPKDFDPCGRWTPSHLTQRNLSEWKKLGVYLTKGFSVYDRDHWADLFHGKDACTVPVLSPEEAAGLAGSRFPLPHPLISRPQTSDSIASFITPPLLEPGTHTEDVLKELGLSNHQIQQLRESKVVTHKRLSKL
ncbi:CoA-transferase family III [Crepidotus variabilis]|uniref:CoA-transferase family III n=1 Tax=Crepidotus variabilis TaxID=179855 RepID=A0A9P6EP54_9AGAR|nr:CoA-transferase family III [Crepidotus variabilis]